MVSWERLGTLQVIIQVIQKTSAKQLIHSLFGDEVINQLKYGVRGRQGGKKQMQSISDSGFALTFLSASLNLCSSGKVPLRQNISSVTDTA